MNGELLLIYKIILTKKNKVQPILLLWYSCRWYRISRKCNHYGSSPSHVSWDDQRKHKEKDSQELDEVATIFHSKKKKKSENEKQMRVVWRHNSDIHHTCLIGDSCCCTRTSWNSLQDMNHPVPLYEALLFPNLLLAFSLDLHELGTQNCVAPSVKHNVLIIIIT